MKREFFTSTKVQNIFLSHNRFVECFTALPNMPHEPIMPIMPIDSHYRRKEEKKKPRHSHGCRGHVCAASSNGGFFVFNQTARQSPEL